MNFKTFINEAKRIELLSDYSFEDADLKKGTKLNAILFNKDKSVVVWAKTQKGQRKVAVPKGLYKKI